MLESVQQPIKTLKACLPQHSKSYYEFPDGLDLDGKMKAEVNAALPLLRKASNGCPACIMAALRQSNIPVPVASDFSFTDEMKAIWDEINDTRFV